MLNKIYCTLCVVSIQAIKTLFFVIRKYIFYSVTIIQLYSQSCDIIQRVKIIFPHTLITVSSREIIVVCGYMYYETRISNIILGIFRLSRPPFLKMAVVSTNVTIIQKTTSH